MYIWGRLYSGPDDDVVGDDRRVSGQLGRGRRLAPTGTFTLTVSYLQRIHHQYHNDYHNLLGIPTTYCKSHIHMYIFRNYPIVVFGIA